MKLIFAVLDVSLTMGLTRCYKTEGFFYIYSLFDPNIFSRLLSRHILLTVKTDFFSANLSKKQTSVFSTWLVTVLFLQRASYMSLGLDQRSSV